MAITLPTPINTASPLGYGMLATYCTVTLPMPDGSTQTTTTVQPTLGLGVNARTGALLPSATGGLQLFAGAIQCRLSTARGGLLDVEIPTTLGAYGIMLPDYLNADMGEEEAGMISAAVDAQVRLDERTIASLTRGVVGGDTLLLPITIQTGEGPFKLTLAVDTMSADISVLASP